MLNVNNTGTKKDSIL